MWFFVYFLFGNSLITTIISAYQIPPVRLEVLNPGFRVSIPDEHGVKLVAFNINRNKPFQSFEQGEFSEQIRKPTNNRWVFETTSALEVGDVIYVWTNVQHDSLVYRSIGTRIPVQDAKTNVYGVEGPENAPRTDFETTSNDISQSTTEGATDSSSCQPSITTVLNQHVCKGELIFEEEFEAWNSSIWNHEIRFALDIDDGEFVLYDNVSTISDGNFKIKPTLWNDDRPNTDIKQGIHDLGARCTGIRNREKECRKQPQGIATNVLPPVISARINTKNSFSFKYGLVEIRAKLPQGDWLVPLLLLEPLTNNYGPGGYTSGQVRIAFARGNQDLVTPDQRNIDGRTLYGGAVLSLEASLREKLLTHTRRSDHFGEKFHVYSLSWDDRKFSFNVDGQRYGEVQGGFKNRFAADIGKNTPWNAGGYMAPFDQEFFITLGLAVGGHGDFPDDSFSGKYLKPWTNTSPKAAFEFWKDRKSWTPTWTDPEFQVDYIRVYAI